MEKQQAFQVDAIEYPLSEGKSVCLNFKISGEQTPTPGSQSNLSHNSYILFILDVSGSMSGSPIQTCVTVLKEMFEFLHNDLGNTNFDLITFNTKPTFIELKNKPLEQKLSALRAIKAMGGTGFVPVFKMIIDILTPDKNEKAKTTKEGSQSEFPKKFQDLSIVFLSDGQAEGIQKLQPHIHNLNEAFKAYTRNCEFHTLGFSSSHDAKLLNELTLGGTSEGSFQYIESSQQIKNAMDAISGIFASKKMNGVLCLEGYSEKIKVSFEELAASEGRMSTWEGMVFIDMPFDKYEQVKSSLKIILQQGNACEECFVNIQKSPSTDEKEKEIKFNLLSMHENLRKITFKLTKEKITKEQAEELNLKLNNYKSKTDDFVREIFKVKIAQREPLFELVEDLKKYLSTFTDLIRSNFLNQLNNEQIAKLNSMAYRNVTRKGLLKKLDKRAHKTVPIINEAFEKVHKIAKGLDSVKLTEKYPALISQVGSCALTCNNFVEALKDEDCLCISFDINRPEIAIADVTRIRIKNIFPTIVSARSFMDSAKFAINKNSEASGGFSDNTQGSIVKGIGSENITAVLPIYVCKEHWDIASQLMKPILGWDITLDPVGYSYFQKKVVPFMLLSHALKMKTENPSSEFNNRVYELLFETCEHIIKDDMDPEFQGTMKEDVLNIQEKYLADGSVRTLDSVQSNFVHLCHMYCFMKMGLIERPKKENFILMLKYMAEEELRRRQTDWDSSQTNKYLTELLRIDIPKYLQLLQDKERSETKEETKEEEKPKEIQKQDESLTEEEIFEKAFLQKLYKSNSSVLNEREKKLIENNQIAPITKEVEETKTNDKPQTKEEKKPEAQETVEIPIREILDGETINHLNGKQKEAFNEYNTLYKTFAQDLFLWVQYFFPDDEFNFEEFSSLEKIGVDSSAKFMCLYLQNKLQTKSADRKAAFTSQRYVSPWVEESALSLLHNLSVRVIMNEKSRLEKGKNKQKEGEFKSTLESGDIEIFAQTSNLNVAAGVLLNGLDLFNFQSLQDILRSYPDSNELVLDKLKMIRDGSYKGVNFQIGFHMRKRFVRKLWKTYMTEYKYNEWKEIWFK